LGQVRRSLESGQDAGTIGTCLNALFQQALRIGKRGHAETGIDRVGASVVDAALDAAGCIADGPDIGAPDTRFVIAGAGSMASLTVSTLLKAGVASERITVTNRTFDRAAELTTRWGVESVEWEHIDRILAEA